VRRALVLTHVAHEGPARVADALARAGLGIDVRRLDLGEGVPRTLDDWDLLVVMGGPMGVLDVGDPRYPFLEAELALIRSAVQGDFPTLGLCLGAQLLAAAAGARVYPNMAGDPPRPLREVGWGAIHFIRAPSEEPYLAGLDRAEVVLHWHGDTFDLPSGAVLLASTLACENQMFRLRRRQFGLQFHVELREADVRTWLDADRSYVEGALGPGGPERILADTARYLPRLMERGDQLLDGLIRAMISA